ncbi:MAG: DUF4349 domain-containing protein [Spirochaetales bacterium]|nr:DUF4349 domain-containing protein [Spirochaetales bacterium]
MRKLIFIIMAFVIAVGFNSCGAQSRSNDAPQAQREENMRAATGGTGASAESVPDMAAAVSRMRVKSGTMTLVVEDVEKADNALADEAGKYSGYVTLSRVEDAKGTVIVKIPADRFDSFTAEAEKLGTMKRKEITVEDVTDRSVDLETRVANKRILLARYQDYLRRAATTNDLLSLERAINDLTTEIESLEGSFRSLKNSIAYSTLTVTLEAPSSLARDLGGVGNFLLVFLKHLLLVVFYTLIVAVPLVLLGGLVYFVGFGRLGLVLKFFRALGRKK